MSTTEQSGIGTAGSLGWRSAQAWPARLRLLWAWIAALVTEGWASDRLQRFNWLPVLIGVGIGAYFALPFEPPVYAGAVAAVPALVYLLMRMRDVADLPLAAMAAVAAVGIGFGAAVLRVDLQATVPLAFETRVVAVSGRVLSAEPVEKGRTRVVLDDVRIAPVPRGAVPHRVRVSLAKAPAGLLPGEWLKVKAVLRPLPEPVAPGSFDFARKLWFDGIGAVGFSMGTAARIEALRPASFGERLGDWMARVRARTSERIRSQLDARTGPIAAAFLTGERALIAEEDQQAMRDSSLAHLLSISGLHMALAGFGFFAALRFIFALVPPIALNYPVKKWAAVAALAASFGYLMLSGASIPTQRSFITIAVAFVAIIADRAAISMRVVAIAALLILLVTPEAWIDPSFQMSFAAVVALVAAYDWWRKRERIEEASRGWVSRALRILAMTAATSLVAGAATAPFAAFHFNRFADYGIAANVMATPVVSFVIMPAGVLALLLMPLGLDGLPLQVMGWGIGVMLDIAHWVASWPGSTLMVGAIPVAALSLMVMGGLWLSLWQARWRLFGVALVLAGWGFSYFGPRPDVLIAADGRQVAVRGADGVLHLLSGRRGVFGAEMWLRRDADARQVAEVAAPSAAGFRCDAAGCVARVRGQADRILVYARGAEALEDCGKAIVLIDQVRGWRPPCAGPQLAVTPRLLRAEGAIAATVTPSGVDWTSVARERGRRPWSMRAP